MRKGITQLALYGLSHIHDNRLARLFKETKVVMEQPDKDSGEWFNMLVLHQNRSDRGPKNYVPENILPDFLDLILWGHEHDCRIQPEEVPGKNFFITQPGSSVATSLSEGEALTKHVGLLEIHCNQFLITPIKLETVRPFVFKSVNLDERIEELDLAEGDNVTKVGKVNFYFSSCSFKLLFFSLHFTLYSFTILKVKDFVADEIEKLIGEAEALRTVNDLQPKEPLIRLRIIYSDEDYVFNAIRLGQQYNTRVCTQ